jgi:pimeloyl-ACP methyl ester carboxylesterase
MTEYVTHWCDLPIGQIRVRTVGSGPMILLTHGLLVDGRIWDRVAPQIAAGGFTVVLPDLPLGSHTVPVRTRVALSPVAVAESLFDIADALGFARFSLIGFDTGGAVAQIAAASRPERIERLLLMSCDAFENFPPPIIAPLTWAARWSPAMSLVLWLLGDASRQRAWLPLGWAAKHPLESALVRAWAAPSRNNAAIRADVVAFIRRMSSVDTLAAAGKLRFFPGQSMILWSREDRVFPLRDAHRLAELLPGCTLEWIDDAYTFAMLDNPARVTELILGFMRATTSRATPPAAADVPYR